MKIAFVYTPGRRQRLEAVTGGRGPSEFFYGAVELARRGHEVAHVEIEPGAGSALLRRAVDRAAAARLTPCRVNGMLLGATGELLPRLRAAQVVFATTSGIALSLGVWRGLGRLRRPIAAIQCGLVNHHHNAARRAWTGRLLRGMWSVLYGEPELEAMRSVFGIDAGRIAAAPFGVDTAFWTPGDQRTAGFVLSVGNDGRRDFACLLEAAERIRLPIRLLTRMTLPDPLPGRVERIAGHWRDGVSDEALRGLYRDAACVAIPLRDALQPSGQSVCLQAMACGAPVVLTRTRGLWDRERIRNGENVLLVPPGDSRALADAVNRVCDDCRLSDRLSEAGRAMVREHADIRNFADAVEAALQRAVRAA
jgi:glycosyltransferase involved in cell wall biosynthesis